MSLSLADFGLRWFEDIIGRLTLWFTDMLTSGYEALSVETLSTPGPRGSGVERVFTQPAASDEPWHSIYEATVAGEMMFFGLIVLFLCVQGRHFIRIFDFGSAHQHRRTRKTALTGGFLIIGWYWVAVLTLYVVEALTIGLLPDVNRVGTSLAAMLPTGLDTPILTLFMAMVGGLSIVFLRALFFIRELLLYVFLYVMPIAIGIVYGNIPVVSEIARRIAVQFVSLAVLPLPTALLFRGYELLFVGETTVPVGGPFFRYIAVISLPLVAVYVTWKTFGYAAPLASRVLGGVGRGAVLAGTVGTAAYVAGPKTAAIAARWGTRGAAGAMLGQQYAGDSNTQQGTEGADTTEEEGGIPEYRRKENDPAYY